jgi:zinc transporter 9
MAFQIIVLTTILALTSFLVGIAPLYLSFSRAHLSALHVLGTGLLLGAALGIIIPEGVEALSNAHEGGDLPTGKLAAALLVGFGGMVVVEHFVGGHSHSQGSSKGYSGVNGEDDIALATSPRKSTDPEADQDRDVEFDAEAYDPEHVSSQAPSSTTASSSLRPSISRHRRVSNSYAIAQDAEANKRAFPLTLGLFFHGLTDGLALGASALVASHGLQGQGSGDQRASGPPIRGRAAGHDHEDDASQLSFVVFLALLIHKGMIPAYLSFIDIPSLTPLSFSLASSPAPTSLALTTSLLSSTPPLSRSLCRQHIAFFSAATPLGALFAYGLGTLIGVEQEWTGIGMLVSGGSFLYVATVLQPVAGHDDEADVQNQDVKGLRRMLLLLAGMGIPFVIASVVGHGH